GLLQKLLSEGIGHSEFKDSELGKIPESWEVIEFGKHLDVKSGFGFKAAEYSESGIPLIKIDNVSYGNIIWENTTYLPTHFTDDYKDLVLVKDDILLALNRPITQNKLKMAMLKEEDAPSILYQRVGKILFNKSYHYKFVYFMLYHYVYDFVIHHSVGTDQPFINISKIRKLLIPLPPLDEQKQITDILSTADEKLEMLRAKKGKYETLKKGLLQKLLSGEVRV
ncbi:MAG: restriction endonuclease subunit S, partial [Arcobacteraceae bacterium]|nr:restriction endonuclease subunit S [Arcobacteraceae bacterium]